MSRFPSVAITLASVVISAAACSPTANVEQERTALMSADREWSQTAKDAEKFAANFTDDAVSYPPGMPSVKGREAIQKAHAEMTKTPGFALSWTVTKADVAASGDIGHTAGTYESTMGGVTDKGKYVTAWKKVNGAWKVTDDIFNSDGAPAAPADAHVMMPVGELKWGPSPPGLPAGAKAAVVSGDPSKAEPYVLRLTAGQLSNPATLASDDGEHHRSVGYCCIGRRRYVRRVSKCRRCLLEGLARCRGTCTTSSWPKPPRRFRCTGWDRSASRM